MRKFILLFLILISAHLTIVSQSCLPEGITFLSQADIDNFQTYYPNCTEIEGDVEVNGDDITNLYGLNVINSIWGNLNIGTLNIGGANSSLTNLSGLENLNLIGGSLVIISNNSLENIIGLENLTSIIGDMIIGTGYYNFGANPSLTSFTGLNNVTFIGGNLEVTHNDALTCFTGLENVVYIGGSIHVNKNSSLSSLTGLENLYSTGGGINIGGSGPLNGNPSLTSLSGLDNLTSIGAWFRIENNDSLTSFLGINNLNTIGGEFWIADNDALISLSGLENLTSIEGDLTIGSNSYISGNHSLTSLSGLINLVFIEGSLGIFDNIMLTSLSGLDNIEEGTINYIDIRNNVSLSTCHVQSICKHLIPPNGAVIIEDNAPGCNSPDEVIAACDSVQTSIYEFRDENIFTISPNPISSKAVIEYFLHQSSHVNIQILDLSGQVILTLIYETKQQGKQNLVVDGTGFRPGVYFCLLKTNEGIQMKKIIKL